MRRVVFLHGYSGTLKTTISDLLPEFVKLDFNINDVNDIHMKLFKKPFNELSSSIPSISIMINHYTNLKAHLTTDRDILSNRGLVDYCFWNYHPKGFLMDEQDVIELENSLIKDEKILRICLSNKSELIKSKLASKVSRNLTDYDRLNETYVERMNKYYSDVINLTIYDHNIDEVISDVVKIINNGK